MSKLRRLRRISRFCRDRDLVFGHPDTGGPLARANVTRRFRASLTTTQIYADYSPNAAESEMVARAFGR